MPEFAPVAALICSGKPPQRAVKLMVMGNKKRASGRTSGVDLDRLRRNLGLTPTARVEKMVGLYEQLSQVRGSAISEGRRAGTLQAIDALAEMPLRSS